MPENIQLGFTIDSSQAGRAIVDLIQKQAKYDDSLMKSIGITREQAKANKELIEIQKTSHELVTAFKKVELSQIDAYKKALIEEGKLDTRIAMEKRQADERYTSQFVANRGKQRAAWASFVSEVKELNTNPLEQFAARQVKLNTAVKAGAIDQQTYNRELARMRAELTGAGQAQSGVVGESSLAGLVKAAGLYAIVTKTVETLKQGFENLRQEMDATVERSDTLLQSRQDLFTASDFDAEKFRSGQKIAQSLTATGVSEMDATKAVTMARQFKDLKDEDVAALGKTQAATGGSLEDKVRMAGAFKNAFPGRFAGTVGTEQISEMAIQAAKSGVWSVGDVAKTMPQSLVSATRLGAKPEEMLAAGSVLSEAFPNSPEMSGDRLALVTNRLAENEKFRGKGLMGSIAILKNLPRAEYAQFVGDTEGGLGEGLSDDEYHKEVGKRIEMAQAVNALTSGFGTMGARTKELEGVSKRAGTGSGMAAQLGGKLRGLPEIGTIVAKRASEEMKNQALEKSELDWGARHKIAANLAETSMIEGGVPHLQRLAARGISYLGTTVAQGLGFGSPEARGNTQILAGDVLSGRGANVAGPTQQRYNQLSQQTAGNSPQLDKIATLIEKLIVAVQDPSSATKSRRGAAQAQGIMGLFGQ